MSNCQEQGRDPNDSKEDHLRKQHCTKKGSLNSGLQPEPMSSGVLSPDANRSRYEGVILKEHTSLHGLLPSFHM